jgi:hypothetical protein
LLGLACIWKVEPPTGKIDSARDGAKLQVLMSTSIITARETGLHTAIRNLSLPGKDALTEVEAKGNCADHLALSFDEQYTSYMDGMTTLPRDGQLLSLQELDSALNAMSGPDNAALWTDASFASDPEWETIRELARKVMTEFGW